MSAAPMSGRPQAGEYAPFYASYVERVPEDDVVAVLAEQGATVEALAAAVPSALEGHRYAPEKWSVRQVIGHLTDGERVFGHRLFCISRGETASLPAFDENAYVDAAPYDRVPLAELCAELVALRERNLAVLRWLQPEDWERAGTANGVRMTVRAIAYVLAGHLRHHEAILRERYLPAAGR
jgi:hypothetical protein